MNLRTKTLASAVLAKSGLLKLSERLLADDLRLVLTLHRVLPENEVKSCYNPYLVLSEGSFEKLLVWLLRHFSVVSLKEVLDSATRPAGGKRLCALTFDDGWEDNFRVAFPILQKYSMPATVFVATGYIGSTQRMPEERLSRLWKKAEWENRLEDLRSDLESSLSIASSQNRDISQFGQELKSRSHVSKLDLLARLEQKYGADAADSSQFMTWDQARCMAHQGIAFESHTANHKLLAYEKDDDIREELTASRAMIKKELGSFSQVVAYPSGSFDDRVTRIVQEVGYRGALTTLSGAIRAASDFYRLPRVSIANDVLNNSHNQFSESRAEFHFARHLWS
jgi:peptidoglycan/xylan/chitin deacetylase (PgdA/CDA1 family)